MAKQYIGRFAPSPSGNLHFGSLVTALGSYLQARSNNGLWLVRIEDIDPPREVAGSASQILTTLEQYGLHWDREVLYQSQRYQAYQDALMRLNKIGRTYHCDCSRAQIQKMNSRYDGHCRDRQLKTNNSAIRLRQTLPVYQFNDLQLGKCSVGISLAEEDFIIHRRDGLFAYNLAVVIDDYWQGVTQVVRGSDLIEVTAQEISLYHHFCWHEPEYLHLPLVCDHQGNKLSKQNHAPALSLVQPLFTLAKALVFLGQPLPDGWQDAKIDELLSFSIAHWDTRHIG